MTEVGGSSQGKEWTSHYRVVVFFNITFKMTVQTFKARFFCAINILNTLYYIIINEHLSTLTPYMHRCYFLKFVITVSNFVNGWLKVRYLIENS